VLILEHDTVKLRAIKEWDILKVADNMRSTLTQVTQVVFNLHQLSQVEVARHSYLEKYYH